MIKLGRTLPFKKYSTLLLVTKEWQIGYRKNKFQVRLLSSVTGTRSEFGERPSFDTLKEAVEWAKNPKYTMVSVF